MRRITSNFAAVTTLLLLLVVTTLLGNGMGSRDAGDNNRIKGVNRGKNFLFRDKNKDFFKNPIAKHLNKQFFEICQNAKPTANYTGKLRTKRSFNSPSDEPYPRVNRTDTEFINDVAATRVKGYSSIKDCPFNVHRQRVITATNKVPKRAKGVIYWMYRDQRVQDNWAFLYAQKLALENQLPLHIAFVRPNTVKEVTIRQYKFILEGLKEVEKECIALNIQFHFFMGDAQTILPHFVKKHELGAIVTDFEPLREHSSAVKTIAHAVECDVPVIQVDAHNIVPAWMASDKQEHVTRAMRKQIEKILHEFNTEFPPVIKHPFSGKLKANSTNWEEAEKNFEIDRTVNPVTFFTPGFTAGMCVLNSFLKYRLHNYEINRYDPLINGLSNLSPWLHFGQISAQRVFLEIGKFQILWPKSVSEFREEILTRRELSENFCFHNSNYDTILGGSSWGRSSLEAHRNDKRYHEYSRVEFENSATHDDLWNSIQLQLVVDGKIHRFLRQYWAKKILEYTPQPEDAIIVANYLNNKYSLDGRDPNGYVGILWAMTGLHDKPWIDRPVFGRVRYLSAVGLRKKFDAPKYITLYGGTVYKYEKY